MRIATKSLLCFVALAAANSAYAREFAACVVDSAVPENPVYYYLPTTGTKLRCEIDRANYQPTLRELYADGWRIITMIDPKVRVAPGEGGATYGDRPSPVIYLERDRSAAGSPPPPAAAEGRDSGEGRKLFGLF